MEALDVVERLEMVKRAYGEGGNEAVKVLRRGG